MTTAALMFFYPQIYSTYELIMMNSLVSMALREISITDFEALSGHLIPFIIGGAQRLIDF